MTWTTLKHRLLYTFAIDLKNSIRHTTVFFSWSLRLDSSAFWRPGASLFHQLLIILFLGILLFVDLLRHCRDLTKWDLNLKDIFWRIPSLIILMSGSTNYRLSFLIVPAVMYLVSFFSDNIKDLKSN